MEETRSFLEVLPQTAGPGSVHPRMRTKESGPDLIARVKVKTEFIDDSFPQDEGFIVQVKVKSEFIDESSFEDKDVYGKLMVDPEPVHCPLRVKMENLQSDVHHSSHDGLSNEWVKQEPCDSFPRDTKNAPQLFEAILMLPQHKNAQSGTQDERK